MTGRWVRALIAGMLLAVLLGSSMPGAVLAQDASPLPSPAATQRPDIVLLLLDDMPLMDDRVWDRLPTIRRLFLEQGVRFSDYSGNDPLCCPGRANLLTGQWSHHHGVVRNDARLFDPRESIATELHDAGYWTGIFGKYFNQTARLRDKWPAGWDQSFIFGGNYWNYPAWANGRRVHYGAKDEDYSTTVIQRRALDALQAAPPDKPRFLWLAPFAIHGGLDQKRVGSLQAQPAVEDIGSPLCAGIPDWSTPANLEFDMSDKPAYLRQLPLIPSRPLVRACEALLSVDRLLAAVLAELAAEGRPAPMIILTADNGMAWGAHRWLLKHVPYATPLPLFIRWDALLGSAPAIVSTTVTNVDIAPTLCAMAGCRMGPYHNGYGVDGISLLPLLDDIGRANRLASATSRRSLPDGITRAADGTIAGLHLGREVIFTEHLSRIEAHGMPPWRGLQTSDEAPIGRWIWTQYVTGETELYDISGGPCWTWHAGDPGDPCELTNLAHDPAYASTRATLATTLAARERHPLRLTSP